MYKHLVTMLAVVCALTVCGCGTARHTDALILAVPQPAQPAISASLPVVPADKPLHPLRMAASAQASQVGAAASGQSLQAQPNGSAMSLPSAAPAGTAYALYHFGGAPGELITGCGYTVANLSAGAKVYCGIADYVKNTWVFFAPQASATGNFDLSSAAAGQYQSALGNSYVLLVAYGGDSFDVQSVSLTYGARFTVAGHVSDKTGTGIADVLVTTAFGGLSTTTDTNGDYSLGGLPSGSWPVFATKAGYTFYDQPLAVTVAGADVANANLLGDAHGSHLGVRDLLPGNDSPQTAPDYDFTAPLQESASAIDDIVDCYNFTVATPGDYYFYLRNPNHDIQLGLLALTERGTVNILSTSSYVLGGTIGLGFTVPPGGAGTYTILFECLAGGGDYTLELKSGTVRTLAGKVLDAGALQLNGGTVTATRQDNGEVAKYYLMQQGPYNFFDQNYPPAAATVEAQVPNYLMFPVTRNVDLSAGSVTNANFNGTLLPTTDTFEPNDTSATAAALAALPYNGTDPLSVDQSGGMDPHDWFKVIPPMGLGLEVRTDYVHGLDVDESAPFDLYDSTMLNIIGSSTYSSNGSIGRLESLTDGNPVYIHVHSSGSGARRVAYRLYVKTYTAYRLQMAERVLPSTLLNSGNFIVHNAQFDWLQRITLPTSGPGYTYPLLVPAGEQVNIECLRFGMAFDRQTRSLTMPASDTTVYFDAPSFSVDNFEPNEDHLTAPALALPAEIDASCSNFTDEVDNYRLTPDTANPFKVVITAPDPKATFDLVMYDSTGTFVGDKVVHSGETNYFPNDGNPGQYIKIPGPLEETAYHLNIQTGSAYVISGNVKTTGAVNVYSASVFNVQTGDEYLTDNSGNYRSLPLPPGNYTLLVYRTGYGPNPNTVLVGVVNSNVTQNFTNLVYNNTDAYEPNDDPATATSIMPGLDYSALVGDLNTADNSDDYKFNVPAAGLVKLTLTGANNFPHLHASSFNLTNNVYPFVQTGPNQLQCTFRTDLTGDWYAQIGGSGGYTLHLDLLP